MNKRRDYFIEAMKGKLGEEYRLIKPDSGFFISLMIDNHKHQNSTFAEVFYQKLLESKLYAPLISGQFLRIPTCGLVEAKLEEVAKRILEVSKQMHGMQAAWLKTKSERY